MAYKNISIYITGEYIRLCDIEKSGSGLTVNHAYTAATPPGSVEDGLIVDVESVAEAIRQAFNHNGIKKARITFTVYSRKIATKEIELPYVKQLTKIGEMIASNVEDYFPMGNMQDYLTRFTVLETSEVEGRKVSRISVVAVQKELVLSYQELGKVLKMPVVTVDYQVNSLYNLMKKQVKRGISLVLQMDNDVTHVTIMNGQAQLFRRAVPYGSDALVQGAAALMEMDEESAYAVLRNAQFRVENLTDEEYGELLRDFSQSVTRVIEFYTTKNPVVIESGIFYGDGTDFVDFADILGSILGIEIETIKKLNGVSVRKAKKKERSESIPLSSYLPNIGAMMQSLDLKIEEKKVQKTGISFAFLFVMMGMAVLGIAGYCGFVWYEGDQLNKDKQLLEQHIAEIRYAEDIYNQYLQATEQLTVLSAYATSTANSNEALYFLIQELERIVPSSMRVESLTASNGAISIQATCVGREAVAHLIISLKELSFVQNVKVSSVSDTYDEFGQVSESRFDITFQIGMSLEDTMKLLSLDKAIERGVTQ